MPNSTLQMIQSKVRTPEVRRAEMQRFGKFATVGLLGSITHFTILNVLVQFAGSPELLANALGFLVIIVVSMITPAPSRKIQELVEHVRYPSLKMS